MWRLFRLAAILFGIAGFIFQIYITIKIQPWGLPDGGSRGRGLDLEFFVSLLPAVPVYAVALGLEWCAVKLRDRPRLKELRAAGFTVTAQSHDPTSVRALQETGFMAKGLSGVSVGEVNFCGRRGQGWSSQVAAQFVHEGRRHAVFAVRCDDAWPRLSTRRSGLIDGERYARVIAEDPAWAPAWFRRRVAVKPLEPGPTPPFINDQTMKLLAHAPRGERWGIGGGWVAVRSSGALSPEMVKRLAARCAAFNQCANGLAEPVNTNGSADI